MKTFIVLSFIAFTSQYSIAQVLTKPIFPGGDDALNNYISKHLTYPIDARERSRKEEVQIRLHINPEGEIYHLQIKDCALPSFEKSIRTLVDRMPNWNPAKAGGENIKAAVNLKIRFAPEF